MRFEKIGEFKLDDLSLDEGNYRFKKAADQKDCVKKIYLANVPYFKGLMKSIAEDDLGEPLLVYQDGNHNIVADGNRRLSALKVLFDDDYAPSDTIREFAGELRKQHNLKLQKIQAQVSGDKALISRTVYERHSGGKNGTSRIPWNAYAAARFGFDEHIGNSELWYIMALLSRTEEEKPNITSFLDSSDFSYDVFRRLIRAAVNLGVISNNIFSERGENIKKTARKDLVKDAVTKAYKFLLAMKRKEITLSRKDAGIYADKESTNAFVSEYGLSPDNQELKDAKDKASSDDEDHGDGGNSGNDDGDDGNDDTDDDDGGGGGNGEGGGDDGGGDGGGGGHGIDESEDILKKLAILNSRKLSGLYRSLCYVSLNQHPALMYVGAWSFLEALSRCAGNTGDDYRSFYNGKMQSFGIGKQIAKDCKVPLGEIHQYGNATKHSKNATRVSAKQLLNDFEVLEPLILAALDEAIRLN